MVININLQGLYQLIVIVVLVVIFETWNKLSRKEKAKWF